ncbi:serine hydrolase domain-containing protein [Sphingomonas canadensis]|uniref:Serine hydrolase domain-containing protein n=1 Tax=Sphingomonas canadensis TaxID=1219257 RepID=A0ABW3H9X7_9SPHN|nr:serine hydrolase domain-containing protein [Sphingomonas canadensis]MCW3837913.1 beta-lactamase family protein [Sphingomonas canadensis]
MRKWLMALAAFALAGTAAAQTVPQDAEGIARLRRAGAEVLFWSQDQRDRNFPAMETIFPTRVVRAGGAVRALPAGTPLPVSDADVAAFIAAQNVAGLIVIQDGKVRLERYARGFSQSGRWTSFSVAKSFTSTLVGAAIRDGYIKSVDEPVTKYIPELAGSGYDGVTIAQLLTMTSGVQWNEDYTDPNSDVAKFGAVEVKPGEDATVAYMRKLPRETAPGAKWVYKTGETNLVGVLVTRATGKTLAEYLSEKIWKPYGMEQDAAWMVDFTGHEIGGCCLSVSLRDYARMGMFALEGGKGVVPEGWFADATRAHATVREGGFGYGYQWWTYPGGNFGGQGIFGQMIFVDPAKKLVIAMVSAWPKATDPALGMQRLQFVATLDAAAGQ